jgi:hypothetical protein
VIETLLLPLKGSIDFLASCQGAGRRRLAGRDQCALLYRMDKTTLVETLVLSEKNRSNVCIKVFNKSEPIVGAVQKVLNQMIILRPPAAQPITLTFADIECVTETNNAPAAVNPITRFFKGLR